VPMANDVGVGCAGGRWAQLASPSPRATTRSGASETLIALFQVLRSLASADAPFSRVPRWALLRSHAGPLSHDTPAVNPLPPSLLQLADRALISDSRERFVTPICNILFISMATGGGRSSSPCRASYRVLSCPFQYQARASHHCRCRRLSAPPLTSRPHWRAIRAPVNRENGAEMGGWTALRLLRIAFRNALIHSIHSTQYWLSCKAMHPRHSNQV